MTFQYIALLSRSGTPSQIVDQRGAPYPTTGTGALVFANNPELSFTNTQVYEWLAETAGAAGTILTSNGPDVAPSWQSVSSLVNVTTITAGASYDVLAADYCVAINKTVGSATAVNLPTPQAGRGLEIVDAKGDCAVNNITIDAGTGNVINGQQTLTMVANYQSVVLRALSPTQWKTL